MKNDGVLTDACQLCGRHVFKARDDAPPSSDSTPASSVIRSWSRSSIRRWVSLTCSKSPVVAIKGVTWWRIGLKGARRPGSALNIQ